MKKILLSFMIIFICGCSNKLVCTYNETYEDIKIRNKIIFDFNTNKYKQIDTMIFKNKESAEKYYKDIENYKDEYNLILDDKKIISETIDDINEKSTKKEIRERFESYDYICK